MPAKTTAVTKPAIVTALETLSNMRRTPTSENIPNYKEVYIGLRPCSHAPDNRHVLQHQGRSCLRNKMSRSRTRWEPCLSKGREPFRFASSQVRPRAFHRRRKAFEPEAGRTAAPRSPVRRKFALGALADLHIVRTVLGVATGFWRRCRRWSEGRKLPGSQFLSSQSTKRRVR